MNNLNRRLFTIDQIEKMEKLARIGRYQDIVSCVASIDPEQEAEIQGIIDRNVSKTTSFESKVMEKYRGVNIDTPELEAEIQKELEVEWDAFIKSQRKGETGEDSSYETMKWNDLKKLATDRGIKLDPSFKKQDIIKLLNEIDNGLKSPEVNIDADEVNTDELKNLEPEIGGEK